MTLNELRYIVAVAEEQHFGRAASRCHVSQPSLSIAVKKLEEELGVVLFERGKFGVKSTPLGEQIVARARRALAQTAEIKDLAEADRDQLAGPLTLGTLPTIGPYLLPQCIPLLQKLAPAMPLQVQEGEAAALARQLRIGQLDAVILSLPFAEADIVVRPLFEEPLMVLLPARHPQAGKSVIAAADIDPAEVLLLGEGQCFREQVLAALPQLQQGAAGRGFGQGATLETLRQMTASGLGITILPQSAAQAALYAPGLLVTRPFAEPAPRRTVALAWRASFPRHKAIDVLCKAVQTGSAAYWNYSSGRDQLAPGLLVENNFW